MWFDNIDIMAVYRRYDGHPGGVGPTRERIATERRIEEIRQREFDCKAESPLPMTAILAHIASAISKRMRIWRVRPQRSGIELFRQKGMRM